MLRLTRADMSQIQTLVAKDLNMERGDLKENSNRQHLEAIEYKRAEEEKKVKALELEVKDLEQKKNKAERAAQADRISRIKQLTENDIPTSKSDIQEIREEDIVAAIEHIKRRIDKTQERIDKHNAGIEQTHRAIADAAKEVERYKKPIYDLKARCRSIARQVAKYDSSYQPKEIYK